MKQPKHLGNFRLHETDNVVRFYCHVRDTLYYRPVRCWIVNKVAAGADFSLDVHLYENAYETGGRAADWNFIHGGRIDRPVEQEFKRLAGIPVDLPAQFHDEAAEQYRLCGLNKIRNFGVN